jgi:hypothetical protein
LPAPCLAIAFENCGLACLHCHIRLCPSPSSVSSPVLPHVRSRPFPPLSLLLDYWPRPPTLPVLSSSSSPIFGAFLAIHFRCSLPYSASVPSSPSTTGAHLRLIPFGSGLRLSFLAFHVRPFCICSLLVSAPSRLAPQFSCIVGFAPLSFSAPFRFTFFASHPFPLLTASIAFPPSTSLPFLPLWARTPHFSLFRDESHVTAFLHQLCSSFLNHAHVAYIMVAVLRQFHHEGSRQYKSPLHVTKS